MTSVSRSLLTEIGRVVRKSPVAAEIISGRGYTAALRLRIRFSDDSTVFVKAATTPDTARWLTVENAVYEALDGHTFLPHCHGFGMQPDDSALPYLILEDLSAAHWPPPWTERHIDAVLAMLAAVHAYQGPLMDRCEPVDVLEAKTLTWNGVATDPQDFLRLGLCSETWLEQALPTLLEAAASAPLAGDRLLHLDVRSDNLCLRSSGEAVLVDWNWICRGNPDLDIAAWLPSLETEGGPRPETILPNAPLLAAWLAGFWAFQAGKPPPEGAPEVRKVQRRQLLSALPWTVRALGLPPLDGVV